MQNKIADQSKIDEIEAKTASFIKKCYIFAQQSPEPNLDELYTDVYV